MGPTNYRIIPGIEEAAQHGANEFKNAQNELQGGLLLEIQRKSSSNEVRARRMMLFGGLGMGVLGSVLMAVMFIFIIGLF